MAKIIDRIVLNTLLFAIFTLWATYITNNIIIGAGIAFILILTISIFTKPKTELKFVPEDYIPKLTTMPTHYLVDLIMKVIIPSYHPTQKKNAIVLGDVLLVPFLKLTPVSADEIYAKARKAKFSGYKKLVLILNSYDENQFNKITQFLPLSVENIDSKVVICALKKANALPEIPKQAKVKPKLKSVFKNAFCKKNFKYFLLSGFSLAILVVFTPFKLYYLVFCTITLSFALLCLFKKQKKIPSYFI